MVEGRDTNELIAANHWQYQYQYSFEKIELINIENPIDFYPL